VDEFKKLLMDRSNASFDCGSYPKDGPYEEYRALLGKALDAERACIEWVEKKLARIAELEQELKCHRPQPTVEDVDRRCLELMEGDRTGGAIRQQLVSEFGAELVEQAGARHSS